MSSGHAKRIYALSLRGMRVGIMSDDIMPCRSDMFPCEACAQFAVEFLLLPVESKLALV